MTGEEFARRNVGKMFEYTGDMLECEGERYRVVGYSNYYPDYVIVENSLGWDRGYMCTDDVILDEGTYRKVWYMHVNNLKAIEE